MLKRKCPSCAKKIERKFNFCPYCGESFKVRRDRDDFGMLGRNDSGDDVRVEQKLPFGMEKIMGSLVKQLERSMGNMNFDNMEGMPKGFKINIVRGNPRQVKIKKRMNEMEKKKIEMPSISAEEAERRMSLKKVEAGSKIRRLADRIIYEIDAPGVQEKDDVVVTELATGFEIRAYSGDRCYVKFIPLKVELIGYSVKSEKVFVELKS
jgi:hypothetical protein